MEIKKVMTPGIKRTIPLELQMFLWSLHSAKTERDYLTVFNFKKKDGYLIVKHSQQEPEYSEEYKFKIDIEVPETVFIIDDFVDEFKLSTILLASEY